MHTFKNIFSFSFLEKFEFHNFYSLSTPWSFPRYISETFVKNHWVTFTWCAPYLLTLYGFLIHGDSKFIAQISRRGGKFMRKPISHRKVLASINVKRFILPLVTLMTLGMDSRAVHWLGTPQRQLDTHA